MAVGFNSRPKEWSRPPEPHPAEADCGSSGDKRRPYVSLIWCSTTSGHGNGLRPWIRNNNRRTAHELLNLTLDLDHAHVSGHQEDQEQIAPLVLVQPRRQGEFDSREQQQTAEHRIGDRLEDGVAALAEADPE